MEEEDYTELLNQGFPIHTTRKNVFLKLITQQTDNAKIYLRFHKSQDTSDSRGLEGTATKAKLYSDERLGNGDSNEIKITPVDITSKSTLEPTSDATSDVNENVKVQSESNSHKPLDENNNEDVDIQSKLFRVLDDLLEDLGLCPIGPQLDEVQSKTQDTMESKVEEDLSSNVQNDPGLKNDDEEPTSKGSSLSKDQILILFFLVLIFLTRDLAETTFNIYVNELKIDWPWSLCKRLWDISLISSFIDKVQPSMYMQGANT